MNETGRRVREQHADTGGCTDHVFAACSILGYAFVPRIRDLPSKRPYVFERAGIPKRLRPLVGGKVNVALIDRNWADILRVASTMAAASPRLRRLRRDPHDRRGQRGLLGLPRDLPRQLRRSVHPARLAPRRAGTLAENASAAAFPPEVCRVAP